MVSHNIIVPECIFPGDSLKLGLGRVGGGRVSVQLLKLGLDRVGGGRVSVQLLKLVGE